eukprot:4639293-Alexandrium_andersonii.AAC.1
MGKCAVYVRTRANARGPVYRRGRRLQFRAAVQPCFISFTLQGAMTDCRDPQSATGLRNKMVPV